MARLTQLEGKETELVAVVVVEVEVAEAVVLEIIMLRSSVTTRERVWSSQKRIAFLKRRAF